VLYANVVLGLPIDGAFDYLVPYELESKIKIGARVWVNFRAKKKVAYVVGLNNKTKIKRLKEITALIDEAPILDQPMLELAKQLAGYYCCSWGEAIETALPDELRKGKPVQGDSSSATHCAPSGKKETVLLFIQGAERLPVYLREIKNALAAQQSAIILFSDITAADNAREIIQKDSGVNVFVAFRKQPNELEVWQKIRESEYGVVIGTRSGIFAPVNNLGLIIIDQDQDRVYKQEQAPHYHARQVALMRAQICAAKVVLGNYAPTLESFYLGQQGLLKFEVIPPESAFPEIKVIDARRLSYAQRKSKPLFSKYLIDAVSAALLPKGKVLLIINRKGFATTASCHNCRAALKCPRCNINLVFHFEEDKLKCHHCNFKMEVPKICPSCNAGYIKYSGIGTEKVESEIARIFPQARIRMLEEDNLNPAACSAADIFVATGSVVKHQGLKFDLIGVLAIDNELNRVDFRSAEKTFNLLMGLSRLTSKKIIIQSANANHYCFQALAKNDPELFYREELKQRKQLNFAPFKHMVLIKLRGTNQDKVKKSAGDLFARLNQPKTAGIKMLSFNSGQPPKLRNNFYYQILMRASSAEKASHFLKLHLKEARYSGIIVTVDVDPI